MHYGKVRAIEVAVFPLYRPPAWGERLMHAGAGNLSVPSGSAVPCGLLSSPVVSPHYSVDARLPQQGCRTEAHPWLKALRHGTSAKIPFLHGLRTCMSVAGPFVSPNQFSTNYFGLLGFFSEIYLDPTHSGYHYTHP